MLIFRARHFETPIKETDIEIAKRKLKLILELQEEENDFDDLPSDDSADEDEIKVDEKEIYVVEKVLDERYENGTFMLEVKWVGYNELTWEPLKNLFSKGAKVAIFLYYKEKWERKLAAHQKEAAASLASAGRDKKQDRKRKSSDGIINREKKMDQKRISSNAIASSSKIKEHKSHDGTNEKLNQKRISSDAIASSSTAKSNKNNEQQKSRDAINQNGKRPQSSSNSKPFKPATQYSNEALKRMMEIQKKQAAKRHRELQQQKEEKYRRRREEEKQEKERQALIADLMAFKEALGSSSEEEGEEES